MNLGGNSTPLVLDDSTGTWHASSDGGQRIELVGAGTAGYNNEYWRVTTQDGIQYYFGRDSIPGSPQSTNATWTVPVYGAKSGDPCYNATFSAAHCDQAWRWNLDFVEDPHHNATAYYYQSESNYYGAAGSTTGLPYVRGGYLDHIDYGLRDVGGTAYATSAPERITFSVAERCFTDSTFSTCDSAHFTAANASHWQDTPQDQQCASSTNCTNHSPTFWTTKRLTKIATSYWSGTGTTYRAVDSYALGQCFPNACPADLGGDPELLLQSITRTGYAADGTSIAEPPVTFSQVLLPNRVAGFNSQPPMLHFRLNSIVAETGAHTSITYDRIANNVSAPCTSTHVPVDQSQNTYPCFPVYWTLPYQTTQTLDYFHKYVVTEVDVSDPNALAPTHVSKYSYLGNPAWHFDDNEVVKPVNRTWGQFRGYQQVQVRTGNANASSNGTADVWTLTQSTYFRGMNGDRTASGGATSGVTVSDSLGETAPDYNLYADMPREVQTFNGDSSTELSTTITDPVTVLTSASRARVGLAALTANIIATGDTRQYTDLAVGGKVLNHSSYVYDDSSGSGTGRLLQQIDTGTGLPTTCTTYTYADNALSWIRNRVSEKVVSQQACPTYGSALSPILSDARTYYDNSTTLGTLPTTGAGDATQVLTATKDTSHWAKTTAGYDLTGRATSSKVYLSSTDTTGRLTSTAYGLSSGGQLVERDVTNALAQVSYTTLDPGRATTTKSIDTAGRVTSATYDQLGRLTAVWQPGRTQGSNSASATYTYLFQNNGPEAVTSKTLVDPGNGTAATYLTSVTLYDALGQIRQTQTDGVGGGRVITDTFHDSHGWVIRANNRWFNSTAPTTTLVTTTDSAVDSRTLVAYDGTGRQTLSTEYQGTTATWATRTIYGGDRTTVIPPTGGVETTTVTDVRGNTSEIDQWTTPPTFSGNVLSGGVAQKTTYSYSALNQLSGMTTATGTSLAASWSNSYDLAGRVIATTDPDRGASSSTWDDANEIATSSDANGQVLGFNYDALGRKISENDGGQTGPQLASWTYDTLQAGQLTSTTRYTSSGNYVIASTGYDSAGNPTGTTTTLPSSEASFGGTLNADGTRSFTTSFGWTSTHLMTSQTPAAGGSLPAETIQYSYDNHGDPISETGTNAYVSASSWSAFGEPNQYSLGVNSQLAWLTYTRDPQSRRVVTTDLSAQIATPQLEHTGYTYDAFGNTVKTVETEGGGSSAPIETQCLRYDALDQLRQAWSATDACAATPTDTSKAMVGGPQPFWTSWTIDAAGNRTQQIQHAITGGLATNATTTYTLGVTNHAHAVLSTSTVGGITGSTGYTYNNDGSMHTRTVAGDTQTLTYTQEGRTNGISASAWGVSYVYGADGDQLIRRDPTTTTLYLPGEEFIRNNSTGTVSGTRYYTFNNTVVSLRNGHGNPQYIYADLHGSGEVAVPTTTTGVGTPIRRYMDPYGNQLGTTSGGSWPDQHGFLGKTQDATTGLSELGERQYDPAIGRFTAPDPHLDPTQPLQNNGYNYAWNNPITRSDPTGLDPAPANCTTTACRNAMYGGTSSPPSAASGPGDCVAANDGDAAACNASSGDGGDGGDDGTDPGPPSGDHCIAGPGQCDPKNWHYICDRQACEVVPANVWVIPGDEWTLVQDWQKQDDEELGGLLLLMSAIFGPEAEGGLKAPVALADDPTYVSPWLSVPVERGRIIEKMFGAKGDNSPTIDLLKGGVATSIKSIDLRSATYQSASKLESKLKGYIDKMAKYHGGPFGDDYAVEGENFNDRELLLAIPEGAANEAQQAVLAKMKSYAMDNDVFFTIRVVK